MAAFNCLCSSQSGLTPLTDPCGPIPNRTHQPVAVCCSSKIPRWATHNPSFLKWSLKHCGNSAVQQEKRGTRFHISRASIAGQQQTEDSPTSAGVGLVQAPRTAAEIVREFYGLINQRDYVGVASLFTEDCEYEDFNFSKPTKGREAILKFFEKVMSSFGTELNFVIDDMTVDDPNAVGVIWHLDWRGKAFPFSRGCSFYRCAVNFAGERQIRFARDIVEPATKPGDVSMNLLRLVTSLFERFPQLADRL